MASLLRMIKRRVKWLTLTAQEKRYQMVGPAELWKMKRDFQIDFLKKQGLKPEDRFLDVGCGNLRGGVPVIQYLGVGNYFGIESRNEVLKEGYRELEMAKLQDQRPNLIHSPDISKLKLEEVFNVIWAFSVLIHMTDAILEDTLKFVASHLADDGVFYANVNIGMRADGDWQGFPVVTRTAEFYADACRRHGLDVEDVGSLSELGHVSGVDAQDTQRMLRIVSKKH